MPEQKTYLSLLQHLLQSDSLLFWLRNRNRQQFKLDDRVVIKIVVRKRIRVFGHRPFLGLLVAWLGTRLLTRVLGLLLLVALRSDQLIQDSSNRFAGFNLALKRSSTSWEQSNESACKPYSLSGAMSLPGIVDFGGSGFCASLDSGCSWFVATFCSCLFCCSACFCPFWFWFGCFRFGWGFDGFWLFWFLACCGERFWFTFEGLASGESFFSAKNWLNKALPLVSPTN